jgi:hypothetical protein
MPRCLLGLGIGVFIAAGSCTSQEVETWKPGVVYPTARDATRGLLDRRGLIHAHSVYSHDACDDEPVKDGARDPVCFDDFRRGLCQSKHDFVMLTDHRDAFDETEFPDALLYRKDRGDTLVERGGKPVASFAACPDGSRALIMAGAEAGTMPVGLEGHAAPAGERGELYGAQSPEAIAKLKAQGAIVLVAHTEGWSTDSLAELPLDGFEMYNLHANAFANAGATLELLLLNSEHPEELPTPDLIGIPIFQEDPRYLEKWGNVLSRGLRRVTTMGTDCHRNSFPALLPDGERGDSYRRMMIWLSNHLLVRPDEDGSWDDRHLKEALKSGRLYGAFEAAGYPIGFDYFAEKEGEILEMGSETSGKLELVVKMPSVLGLDATKTPPDLTLRILRATSEGFEEVASGKQEELRFEVNSPGAYRAEVRMVPKHLANDLGKFTPDILTRGLVWVYSNPIYVR